MKTLRTRKSSTRLYLALGDAAREQFMDEYPNTALWELKTRQLTTLCTDCFRKKKRQPGSPPTRFKIATTWRKIIPILPCIERACGYLRFWRNYI